jgi:hypothetical protein
MKPSLRACPAILAVVVFVGCAASNEEAPIEKKTLSERLNEKGGYKQDENGQWVPRSNKRSSFEAQGESPYFKGEFDKKTYQTGEYAKKSWWGTKSVEKKEYAGNTDASRFLKSAPQQGLRAKENGADAGLSKLFKTNTLENQAAREAGKTPIERTSNAYTESRKDGYEVPAVTDWQEQRSMSLEQSKSILGR